MKRSSLVVLLLAIGAAGGTALYEAHLLATERAAIAAEEKRAAQLQRRLTELRGVSEPRPLQSAAPETGGAGVASDGNAQPTPADLSATPAQRADVASWLARIRRLKQSFADQPGQAIPELGVLSDLEWMTLTRDLGSLDSEEELRQARAVLRNAAAGQFIRQLRDALRDFATATNGMLPSDVAQLQPYLKTSIDPAVFARYEMRALGDARTQRGKEAIAQRAPIDEELDVRYATTTDGGTRSGPWALDFMRVAQDSATAAYAAANGGARPPSPADLLPYMQNPAARAINEAMIEYRRTHQNQQPSGPADLRPYVTDPAARAKLELLIRLNRDR